YVSFAPVLHLPSSPTRRSSDLPPRCQDRARETGRVGGEAASEKRMKILVTGGGGFPGRALCRGLVQRGHEVVSFNRSLYPELDRDRKSTRLNSSHVKISYAVFC